MYYVYVLKSLNFEKFYKGLTDNLDRRLQEHFEGKCQTTKLMLPIILVHVEICRNIAEARKLERFFLNQDTEEKLLKKYIRAEPKWWNVEGLLMQS